MKRLRLLWIVLGAASVMTAASWPALGTGAQGSGDEATVRALQTEAATLKTKVALQTEVASLRTQVTAGSAGATETPDANPVSGTVLYESNWSSGMDGWDGLGWRNLDGMLVTDGTSEGSFAADNLETTTDYAVEAEVQVTKIMGWENQGPQMYPCGNSTSHFGLFIRDGEYSGITCYNQWSGAYLRIRTPYYVYDADTARPGPYKLYDPGGEWHAYRLEVEGNTIRFMVDGVVLMEEIDNQVLSDAGGDVGFICNYTQLSVRSFKVIAL